MAKKSSQSYDLKQFKTDANNRLLFHYDYGWDYAKGAEKRWHDSMTGKQSVQRKAGNTLQVQSKYRSLFNAKTEFTTNNNRLKNWSRVLALRGGDNPVYDWRRGYFKEGSVIRKDSSKRLWGANLNHLNKKDIGKTNIGKGAILKGSKEWIRQIQISIHQLGINAESFRIAVGHRALKVFQDSFRYQQFWTTGSSKWPALSTFTKKKRAARGTGSKILREYGDLYQSIKLNEQESTNLTRIYTDKVEANDKHHKKHTLCYAGYHNNPRPGHTYGNGWGRRKPRNYIQRQFMGHSDKIDSFAFSVMKRYLFDSVFLIKKV